MECIGCGDVIRGLGTKYCTQRCAMRHINQDPERQRKKGKAGGIVRGAQFTAERMQRGGHFAQGYTRGKTVMDHRQLAEQVLGRALLPGEIVHHEDSDRANNVPSNLIVFPSQGDHARHHKLNHCGSPCECPGIRLGVMPNATP